ncbi:MAG: glycosyltransferase family 39 protein [Flavobacteriales bacterium]|nr:glycosyltransferase family 39 protein [Flavobacteriales bacterium]
MARKKSNKQQENLAVETDVKSKDEFILNKIDWAWVGLGLTFLITFFIRLKFLDIPFERDEGTYTYFGQLLLDGQIPYVDFYEMKYPGIYYSYAGLIAIFGATVKGIHLAFIFLNLATIFFIFQIGKTITDKWGGLVAALSYAILSLAPHVSGFTVQSEHLVTFYSCGGIWLLLLGFDKKKWFYYFMGGFLIGFSFLIKQNGVFFILFGGLSLVVYYALQKPISYKQAIKDIALYSGGVFTPFIAFCLLILSMGAFDEFWYFTYEFPKTYVEEFNLEQGKQLFYSTLDRITANNIMMWGLSGIGFVAIWISRQTITNKIIITLFGIASFISIAPGLRFYGHYWIMMMPGVAVCVGAFVYSLMSIMEKWNMSKTVALSVPMIIFGIAVASNWSKESDYYMKPNHTKILREVYGTNPFPESMVIGDYIKARTTEEDEIVVLGSEPQIYFYTDRKCPSKHSYTTWLVNAGGLPIAAEFQKEFIIDVEEAMPKYMVFFNHPISWLMHPNADKTIFTWFNTFSQQNYKLVGVADMVGPNQTDYLWDQQVLNYKPKGQYYIWVFERKNDV